MFIAKVTLESLEGSPYSQSRYHATPKGKKEGANDYEERTWRNKCHVNGNGNVIIPPSVFKGCLQEAAKYLSIQIPGKGKATYTKHFEAGVAVARPMDLGVKPEDARGNWILANANGRPGPGSRVPRCFPTFDKWSGDVEFEIFDETVTEEVFLDHLKQAGIFIGIGQHRPRNRGYFGRFRFTKCSWEKAA